MLQRPAVAAGLGGFAPPGELKPCGILLGRGGPREKMRQPLVEHGGVAHAVVVVVHVGGIVVLQAEESKVACRMLAQQRLCAPQ